MIPGPYKTYFGGKNGEGVYQTIINTIRPHDVYMELFLGSGAVYRAKKPAKQTLLNDLNRAVINDWVSLAAAIDGIVYTNRCAIELLASWEFLPDRRYCIYLDPPYPLGSRSDPRERYACEMTDDDHRQLLLMVRYLPDNVDVLISTYANPIYAEMLHDFHLVKFQAMTRQGPATEYLYINYDPSPGLLHDYRYLGVDYIDRQRIKRKIAGKIEQLKALPAAERNAILAALSELRTAGTDENVLTAAQMNSSVEDHAGQYR